MNLGPSANAQCITTKSFLQEESCWYVLRCFPNLYTHPSKIFLRAKLFSLKYNSETLHWHNLELLQACMLSMVPNETNFLSWKHSGASSFFSCTFNYALCLSHGPKMQKHCNQLQDSTEKISGLYIPMLPFLPILTTKLLPNRQDFIITLCE